jgi:3-(3-hydroxy-phenyl)propionate hydroxylase
MNNSAVLIVGAGPVGLTLAWRLYELGIEALVFESAPHISDQLRASTFHPPTLDMFDRSGITHELIERGRITPEWQIRMHATGQRAQFDLGVLKNDTDHPYRLQCHQAELSRALLRRLPSDCVRFGVEVTAVGDDSNGVWVDTGQGKFRANFLVGCDGARSIVRKCMGVEFEGGTYPDNTILVTTSFPFHEHIRGLSGVNYIWKTEGTYSLLRLPDVWRISLHPRPDQSPEEALADDSIRAQTREILPDAPDLDILEKRIYRVHHRVASVYRKGRLLLAGDAAHLNNPKGGMGLNGGIHDVFSLSERLCDELHGAAHSDLDRYERQRRPIAQNEIIAQADANRKRMNTNDPEERRRHLESLQDIATDPQKAREFLLKSSMITGLQRAATIA